MTQLTVLRSDRDALHPIDFSDKKRDVIQSMRLVSQKMFAEQDRRDALTEASEGLAQAEIARTKVAAMLATCDTIVAERSEMVRLAGEALAAAGVVFDGAALDLAETIRRDCPRCAPAVATVEV